MQGRRAKGRPRRRNRAEGRSARGRQGRKESRQARRQIRGHAGGGRRDTRAIRTTCRASRSAITTSSRPELMKKFGYKNAHAGAEASNKIVLNIGAGEAASDSKKIQQAQNDLTAIAGQKAVVTRAKKAIATFKIREGPADRREGHAAQGPDVRIPRPADHHGAAARARLPRPERARASTAAATMPWA